MACATAVKVISARGQRPRDLLEGGETLFGELPRPRAAVAVRDDAGRSVAHNRGRRVTVASEQCLKHVDDVGGVVPSV